MKSATHILLKPVLPLCLLMSASLAQADQARSTVELDGIKNIHLLSSFRLVVSQGNDEYVAIIADSDYIDQVEARIKGDTLALGQKRDSFWSWFGTRPEPQVSFEVQVKDLEYLVNRGSGSVDLRPFRSDNRLELSLQGSGSIRTELLAVEELDLNVRGSGAARIDRVEAGEVAITVRGSGDVDLSELYARQAAAAGDSPNLRLAGSGSGNIRIADGEVRQLDIDINGSGDVDLADLRAREARVSVNGSGDVEVNVNESLDVRVNGSGDVIYRGQPAKVRRSINGSGDVQARN